MTQKKSRFDWYATRQRFSIRKYHIGAASVLLGTALVLGTAATVSADETTTAIVTTAESTETPDADQAPAVDKTALTQALEAAKAIDLANKPAALSESFVEVFTQTTDLLNKADATQEEVDAALVKLNTAVEAIKAAAAVELAPEVLASAVETPEADELAPVEETTELAAEEVAVEKEAEVAYATIQYDPLTDIADPIDYDKHSTKQAIESAGIPVIEGRGLDWSGIKTSFGELDFVTRPGEFKPHRTESNMTLNGVLTPDYKTLLEADQVYTYKTIYGETAKIEITGVDPLSSNETPTRIFTTLISDYPNQDTIWLQSNDTDFSYRISLDTDKEYLTYSISIGRNQVLTIKKSDLKALAVDPYFLYNGQGGRGRMIGHANGADLTFNTDGLVFTDHGDTISFEYHKEDFYTGVNEMPLGLLIRNGAELRVDSLYNSAGVQYDSSKYMGGNWGERTDITKHTVTVQWSDGDAPHPDIQLYPVRKESSNRWGNYERVPDAETTTLSNGTTTATFKELPVSYVQSSTGRTITFDYEARLVAVPTGYYATYDDANNIIKLTKFAEITKTAVKDKNNLTETEKTAIKNEILAKNPGLSEALYYDGGLTVDNQGNVTLTLQRTKNEADSGLYTNTTTYPKEKTVLGYKSDREKADEGKKTIVPTPVKDKANLTTSDKAAVTAAIKTAYPNLPTTATVTVNTNGTGTITFADGSAPIALTQAQLVTERPALARPTIAPVDTDDRTVSITLAQAATSPSDVTVTIGGQAVPANKITVAGTKVTVALDAPLAQGTPITAVQSSPTQKNSPTATATVANTQADANKGALATIVPTPVNNKNALTPEEKAAVKAEILAKNPTLAGKLKGGEAGLVVDNQGNVTLTYPDNSTDKTSYPQAKTVREKTEAEKHNPLAPNPKVPVDNTAALTPAEKQAVIDAIRATNPTLPTTATITVANNGTATVRYSDNSTDTLPGTTTVTQKATSPAPAIKPVDSDDRAITGTGTPGATVTVKVPGQPDKTATVTPAGTWSVPTTALPTGTPITATQTEPGKKASNPATTTVAPTAAERTNPVAPAEKTPVDNINNLTPAEKQDVADAIRDANPTLPTDAQIAVAPDGTATITFPEDGSSKTLPGSDLVRPKTEAEKHNPVAPAEKTPVGDITNLTPAEKQEVVDAIKAANPTLPTDAQIEVAPDGTATITYPKDGSKDTIPGTDLVRPKTEADKNAANLLDIVPTPVNNKDALTADEKEAIKAEIADKNPGLLDKLKDIIVANNGDVTLVYNDDSTDTTSYPQAKTVSQKSDADKNAANLKAIVPTPVGRKSLLTEQERQAVKAEIIAKNPGLTALLKGGEAGITVALNGNVTLTYPDNSTDKTSYPQAKTVREKTAAEKHNPVAPADKVPVGDIANLTPAEKQEVVDAIKAANPTLPTDAQIAVAPDGTATITFPEDGSSKTIPGTDLVTPKPETAAEKHNPVAPAEKTPVDDITNLTPAEKQEVADAIKAANPSLPADAQIDVAPDGTATITFPEDGSSKTIPGTDLVAAKGTTPAPAIKPVDSDDQAITGTGTPGATVTVKVPGQPDKTATVSPAGTWSVPTTALPTGTPITATQTEPGKKPSAPVTAAVAPTAAERTNPVAPATKVPVGNTSALTPAEKQDVVDAIKAANPSLPADVQIDVAPDGTATITFPEDGSSKTIPGADLVTAKPAGPLSDLYQPLRKDGTVPVDTVLNPEDFIANRADLPADAKFQFLDQMDTGLAGTSKIVRIRVTYSDGSFDDVRVRIRVANTNAQDYVPFAVSKEISLGASIRPVDFITNSAELPATARYTWLVAPSLRRVGGQQVTIVVTYPDGSTEQILSRLIIR